MSNTYIDTTSYTNKDFRSIWPELLDLVTDLTNSWDPNNSNEADPGVALLKLQAFIADKLNYNIDKNVLEAFPSSVTQRGNAQKLYDLQGYELKQYRSATTEVFFKFINPKDENQIKDDNGIVTFKIPRFAQIKDPENKIIYTVLEETSIDTENHTQTEIGIPAIEGALETFLINGVDTITINNLDADYRLYFNESMVASNGIFINNVGTDDFWESTFNLESTELANKVFKFGVLPGTNQCYIEFPQDAAELFQEGIQIHYVISSGVRGNISAGTLQEFAEEYANYGVDEAGNNYSLNTYVKVANPSGTTNGQDPESLEQAYDNYQRTVNTFSTLVTLQDYYNAIYNEGEVSNCLVTDRTNDFNASYKVRSRDLMGECEKIFKDSRMDMNAFNLAVYVLDPIPEVFDKKSYDKTFKTSYESQSLAIDSIDDYKSVQHDWIDVMSSSANLYTYLLKNMIKISGQIITYEKKSTIEANEIIKKVKETLYKKYQSRNIKFGKDLDYDELIKVIIESDPRIKTVILNDLEYDTNLLTSSNSEYSLLNESGSGIGNTLIQNLQLEIIARSILAGVTPLFLFDHSIKYNYTMGPTKYIVDYSYNDATDEISQPATPTSGSCITSPYTDVSLITTQVTVPLNFENQEIEVEGIKYNIKVNYTANDINTAVTSDLKSKSKVGNKTIDTITWRAEKSDWKKTKKSKVTATIKFTDTENLTKYTSTFIPYRLKKNESVSFYAPNFISTAQLSTYLNVCLKRPATDIEVTLADGFKYKIFPQNNNYITLVSSAGATKSVALNSETEIGSKKYVVTRSGDVYEFTYTDDANNIQKFINDSVRPILANSIYQLKPGEKLYVCETLVEGKGNDNNTGVINRINYSGDDIKYIPLDGTQIEADGKLFKVYNEGTIIKPSFNITAGLKGGMQLGDTNQLVCYVNLESSKTIDIIEPNISNINKKNPNNKEDTATKTIYCTWVTDDLDNHLFDTHDEKTANPTGYISHILKENEIFLYTDSTKSDLILLESGTRVSIPYNYYIRDKNLWKVNKPSVAEINQHGVNALEDFWMEIPRNLAYFRVEELQIHTLGEGTAIYLDDNESYTGNTNNLTNKELDLTTLGIDKYIRWKVADSTEVYSLPTIELNSDISTHWYGFSRLSFLATPEIPCTLYNNQVVALFSVEKNVDGDITGSTIKGILGPGQSFTTNYATILTGGIKQNVEILKDDETYSPISVYPFTYRPLNDNQNNQTLWQPPTSLGSFPEGISISVTEKSDGSIQTTIKREETATTDSVTLTIPLSGLLKGSIIPLIVESPDTIKYRFNLNHIDGTIFATEDEEGQELLPKYHNTIICLDYPKNTSEKGLTIELSQIQGNQTILIYLYPIKHYIGRNSYLPKSNSIEQIMSRVNTLGKKTSESDTSTINFFDYSYEADEQDQILNPLDPTSFYDNNHICNHMTISQIESINIQLARQSKQ